ncbi:MAG TPA: co-chaperone DjlA [Steroidobacteraceae bacterium]|nr:co-chaperone DjlA [Steroidobacteraceae bacterium]
MSIVGKIVGGIIGYMIGRFPGLIVGIVFGHFYDQGVDARRARPRGSALEIGERFFTSTFEVMGHVAKADGRVSEAEIAAARKLMSELRLDGAQIHIAIAHFTRGKSPQFDLEETIRQLQQTCGNQPHLLRAFLELQVRAALEGVDMQGAARDVVFRLAELLDISRLEVAHMEAVLRLRRDQFRNNGGSGQRNGNGAGAQSPPRSGMRLDAAYQILEVDPKVSDAELSKAYRRQLSKHHPDKLKANGLPDSMLEHAKQRTQQIIEAYELIKAARGM